MSHQLTLDFGKGYSRSGLFRIVRFAKLFPEAQIVATLSRQLSWSHVILLCQIEDELPRNFYGKTTPRNTIPTIFNEK